MKLANCLYCNSRTELDFTQEGDKYLIEVNCTVCGERMCWNEIPQEVYETVTKFIDTWAWRHQGRYLQD